MAPQGLAASIRGLTDVAELVLKEVEDASWRCTMRAAGAGAAARSEEVRVVPAAVKAGWVESLAVLTGLQSLTLVSEDLNDENNSQMCLHFMMLAKVLPSLRRLSRLSLWRMNYAVGGLTGLDDEDILEIGRNLRAWPLPLLSDFEKPENFGDQPYFRSVQLSTHWRVLDLPAAARCWENGAVLEYFRLQQCKVAAFAGGHHPRLGRHSKLRVLDENTLILVAEEAMGRASLRSRYQHADSCALQSLGVCSCSVTKQFRPDGTSHTCIVAAARSLTLGAIHGEAIGDDEFDEESESEWEEGDSDEDDESSDGSMGSAGSSADPQDAACSQCGADICVGSDAIAGSSHRLCSGCDELVCGDCAPDEAWRQCSECGGDFCDRCRHELLHCSKCCANTCMGCFEHPDPFRISCDHD